MVVYLVALDDYPTDTFRRPFVYPFVPCEGSNEGFPEAPDKAAAGRFASLAHDIDGKEACFRGSSVASGCDARAGRRCR